MSALAAAVLAGAGTHLVFTAIVLGWRGVGPGPRVDRTQPRRRLARTWLVQAGLGDVALREIAGVTLALALVAGALAWGLLGAPLPALAIASAAGSAPLGAHRARRQVRLARAQEAWPRLLEEVRIRTGSLGRSIPQALFDVGRRAPVELRPAFEAAHREWLISTDFDRALGVLKADLADPTADATCETLLVAHHVGGGDLDRRLEALIEDRIQDTQGRKDARARQAGARFSRRFVVVAPFGMALAGMSVGSGRAAFGTPTGQSLSLLAIAMVGACWWWAGSILRLPEEQRVFER